jgi:simple sugar transport system ATP-binding protein
MTPIEPVGHEPIVELTNINKSFGRVYALEGINLKLYPGEIVALVGDNGAGKSTLTKIISGIEKPDPGGRITIDQVEPRGWSAAKARDLGIETVHQSRALSEQQTIYNNVFMGRERTNFLGFVKRKEEIAETEALLRRRTNGSHR